MASSFSDSDAACFASFWSVACLVLRGPALHLHGRRADVQSWAKGHCVGKDGRFGPCLLLAFYAALATVAFPHSTLPFAVATTATALHQAASLHRGQGHSYMLVFVSNISLSAASIAALATGCSLRAAVVAAAPAVLEAYALLMFWAALGKFNTQFFDPKRSAATVHVIGSIENLFALLPAPFARSARALVNAAGPGGMSAFFVFTAWLGAVVESAVCLLMYLDQPKSQAWTMYAMHGIFAFTAFDFSVASSGVMPLFGLYETGAVTACLGWLITPWARTLVPALLLWVMLTPVAGGVGSDAHISKLRQLSFVCRLWFFLSVPVLYIGAHVPHGSFLLGIGTEAREDTYASTREELGAVAYFAVQLAAFITISFSILNGAGPYGGWKVRQQSLISRTTATARRFLLLFLLLLL